MDSIHQNSKHFIKEYIHLLKKRKKDRSLIIPAFFFFFTWLPLLQGAQKS